MSTVDSRIVEMRFENRQFENGIQSSIKSLDKLKNGLNLDNAASSLSNLDKAGKSFSLANIASGVESISNKFSALNVIGMTALANITNSAINAGKRMLSALTVDPIKSGFQEYETKMNAIQTILTNTQSKGTTLDEVNDALAELNTYSDKTIYNFAQMTDNIGKFTAAGVGLDDSVMAIQGMANVAAGFGVDATKMAGATYQMSQALSAGVVKLQDWNSMQQAGMGGEMIQKELRNTAKELGIFVDESIPFRESLQSNWLSSEVFIKTMGKMAKDESLTAAAQNVTSFTKLVDTMQESVGSGWAVTWENIIGDKDQSTKMLTNLSIAFSNLIAPSADARNEMLKFWNQNGGRDAIITAMSNAFKTLGSILGPIKDAFREVFPATTGQQLVDISLRIKELSEKFKMGEDSIEKLKTTFKGLFSLLDLGRQAFMAVGSGVGTLLGYLIPATGGVLDITARIGEFLISLNDAAKRTDIFNVTMSKLTSFLSPIANGISKSITMIKEAFNSMVNIDTSGIESFADKVQHRFSPVSSIFDTVGKAFQNFGATLKRVAPSFYNLASMVGEAFEKLSSVILNAFKNANFSEIFDMVNTGLLAGILIGLKKFVSSMSEISDGAGGFLEGVTGILDGVKGSLEAYQSSIKAGTIMKIAIAMGILSASLVALSLVDSQKLTNALVAMSVMFAELFGSMTIFEKIMTGPGFKSMGKVTMAMISLSIAISILASALVKISSLDFDSMVKGLAGIAGLSAILVTSARVLSESSGKLIKGSMGLVTFAIAINVLVTAVEKLAVIDTPGLTKGLIGVGVLCAELALFMNVAKFGKMGVSTGLGLIALAGAILLLSKSVEAFSVLDPSALQQGLVGIGLVLAELALFVNLTGNASKVTSTAVGLTILGAAMLIFSQAISQMGSLSIETIGKGLISMAGALTVITVAMNLLPKGMVTKATGILVVSAALVVLSKALENMGGMSWDEIGKGLVTLAGSLTIISVAMMAMTGALPGAAALLVISGALAGLSAVLKIMGSMSWDEIGKSLLTLVGIFAVVGGASLILAPLTPVILGLSAAIALLGVGCVAVGAGILAFSAGLAALAVSGTAGAVAFVAVIASIVGVVPIVVKALADGIIQFAKLIGESAPTLVKAITTVLLELLKAIDNIAPKLIQVAGNLLVLVLKTIVKYTPMIIQAGIDLLVSLLKGIADNIGKVVSTAVLIVTNFIKALGDSVLKIVQAGVDLIISLIEGMAKAIRTNTPRLMSAMGELIDAVIDAAMTILKASVSKFLDVGKKIMNGGLIKGITNTIGDIVSAIGNVISSAINTIGSSVSKFRDIGKNVMMGFINGIKDKVTEAAQSAANLADNVVTAAKNALGIHSPSRVFKDEVGAMIARGVADGIKDKTGEATKASNDMSESVYNAAKEWIDNKKYYNEISLKEELYVWEQIQAKYEEGNKARIEADKETYRLKNEISKQEYDNSVKYIEDKKFYNQMSLGDELKAWERVQKRYVEGTEERKNADKQVYSLRKQLMSELQALDENYYNSTQERNQQLLNDIESVNKAYEDAVKSRAQSLANSYSLFDAVGDPEEVSGDTLLNNLEDQVDAFDDWQRNINALAKRGISDGLLKELQDMGPKSSAQIKALNSLSSSDLAKYVDLWEQKYQDATDQAINELEDLKYETSVQIKELNEQADIDLESYTTTWKTKTAELTVGVTSEFDNMSTGVTSSVANMKTETEQLVSNMTTGITQTISKNDWEGLGNNIILGIRNGIREYTYKISYEIEQMANEAIKTAKKTLGIHSPSRAFAEVGMFVDRGFAEGIRKFSGLVENESGSLGDNALSSIRDVLSSIPDMVNGDLDYTPTIRPVLDMTSVMSGVKNMNGLMDSSRSISIAGNIGVSASKRQIDISSNIDKLTDTVKRLVDTNNSPVKTPIPTPIINVNGVSGNAMEISRQIQKDLNAYYRAIGAV